MRQMGRGLKLTARRKTGELFRVDVSLSPVSLAGELRIICVVRDLSEYLHV